MKEPTGYFVLTKGPESRKAGYQVEDDILKNPNVKGAVLRDSWAACEPSPGKYNWEYLDKQYLRVLNAGKQVKLTLFSGFLSPLWSSKRWRSFANPNRQGIHPNATYKIPVPWDAEYMTAWARFVKAAGQRFGVNTIETNMGGATRFSNEMFLPEELKKEKDYSDNNVISAWSHSIDAYDVAFPQSCVCLNLAPVFKGDTVIITSVVNRLEKLGLRATFQHDSLSPETSDSYSIQKLLMQEKNEGRRIGYEFKEAEGSQGRFNDAIWYAQKSKAQYVDIYWPDLKFVAKAPKFTL